MFSINNLNNLPTKVANKKTLQKMIYEMVNKERQIKTETDKKF
jgi:hypothetical protein